MLFCTSDFIASIGHFVHEIAVYWLVYETTGSALALGLLGLCEAAPSLILTPLIGVLVDRHNRQNIMILVQFFAAIPIIIVTLLYFAGVLELWHILTLQAAHSVARVLNPPTAHSMIRELVPQDDLVSGVALFSMEFNIARVLGPSLGGVLLLWIGAGGCFVFYTALLLISGLGFLLMHLPKKEMRRGQDNYLREVSDGFRYIWHEPVIMVSIGATYILSIFVGTYHRFLPVFAKQVLNVGPGVLGLLMAAQGFGGILSLSFLTPMVEKWNKETLIFVAATSTPVFLILFSFSNSLFFSLVLLTLVGATGVAYRTICRVIIQMRVPYNFLGRVMSVFQMDQGMRSIGSMAIGTFIALFGITFGLVITSVVSLILTTAIFVPFLKSLRNAHHDQVLGGENGVGQNQERK